MYVCIYTTTGASYPPHPMGGEHGTRDHIYIHVYIYIYVYEYVLTDRSTVLIQRMIPGWSPHFFVQGGWTMLHWAAKHGKKVRTVELHPEVPWG